MICGEYILYVTCERADEDDCPEDVSDHGANLIINGADFPSTDGMKGACIAEARKEGWRINYKNNVALCPACTALGYTLGQFSRRIPKMGKGRP